MIPALELIRPACNVVTPFWQLVGPVGAVSFTVAHPAFVYAREIVVAVEVFVLVAMAWSFAVQILTSNFVDFIRTIEITVAFPSRRYAIILGAGEF